MLNPVVLLSFANSFNRLLPGLQVEYEAIRNALRPKEMNRDFDVQAEISTTASKLTDLLHDYADRIVLFHYSGHASDKLLETVDVPAHAIGIARLLSKSPSIRCVVLNGCATKGQVEDLLLAGVPVVIATDTDIEDHKAVAFSKAFYQDLGGGGNLDTAFQAGIDAYTVLAGGLTAHRGVYKNFGQENKDDQVLGIFCREEKYLKWTLDEINASIPEYKPNEKLIQRLGEVLARPGSKLKDYQGIIKAGGDVPIGTQMNEVLQSCPFPIYEQLRLLLQPSGADKNNFGIAGWDMLQQIAINYSTAVRMISLVMLARLWEIVMLPKDDQEINLSQDLKEKISHYLFDPNREKFESLSLVQLIRTFLDEQKYDYFVGELSKLKEEYQEGTKFFAACNYLEDLNDNFREWMNDNRIRRNSVYFKLECKTAEEYLADFFEPLGFISRYEMRSIQNIDLSQVRTERKINYQHYFITLAGGPYNGLGSEILEEHFDPSSVALVRDFRKRDFLNLSPFIMDKNTYSTRANQTRNNEFKLMFFDNIDQAENLIEFTCVYNPKDPPLQINQKDPAGYKPVHDQIQAFIEKLKN